MLAQRDRHEAGIARALGFRCTRYADDLTFSGAEPERLASLLAVMWSRPWHRSFCLRASVR